MTLTRAPTGIFRITPDDGSIYFFEMGRAPDLANVQEHDLGQTVARSEGTKVYVLGKAVETNVYRFRFSGLTSSEFHYFRLYVQDQLQGSKEPATIEWGRARNRILFSSSSAARNSEHFNNWTKTGASPPTVNDDSITGPEGFAGTASEITFSGAIGASVLRCPGVLTDFGIGAGTVTVSAMMKITDGGGSYGIRLDSGFPANVDFTLPDDGNWHKVAGSYSNPLTADFDIQNNQSDGSRTVGLTRVMVAWHPSRDLGSMFYDQAPLHTIANAKYVPDTFAGKQRRDGVWDVEALFREEVA